jgi:mannose-6-phosphate isomerase-like protein (cupin superfamily)
MGAVSKYKPETEWLTPERCYITELANSAYDETCSIALARVSPGVVTQLHSVSGAIERYVILEGRGRVEIDAVDPVLVKRFDIVNIPAGVSQRIANAGKTDLVFLAIRTPRFKPDRYRRLE